MRTGRLIAALLGGSVLAVGTVAWLNRESIVRGFVADYLDDAGVTARYDVRYLGPLEQRLDNIVVGDPARPDLTIRHMTIRLEHGLTGPRVAAVALDGVRARGAWRDGQLSLGQVDRLLPESDGTPPELPDMRLDLRDARLAVTSPWGAAGIGANGRGHLRSGFVGRVAFDAPKLAAPDCSAERVTANIQVRIRNSVPVVRGPAAASSIACKGQAVADIRLGIGGRVPLALTGGTLRVGLETGAAQLGGVRIAALGGAMNTRLSGGMTGSSEWSLSGRSVDSAFADAGTVTVGGRVALDRQGSIDGAGSVSVAAARLDTAIARQLGAQAGSLDATPVGPVGRQLATALSALSVSPTAGSAVFEFGRYDPESAVRLSVGDVALASSNGVRLRVPGNSAVGWLSDRGTDFALIANLSGGGLPAARAMLNGTSGRWQGRVEVAPVVAGNARLALSPVNLAGNGSAITIATRAELSGPLASGRVEALQLPVSLRYANGALALAPGCMPVSWNALDLGSVATGRTGVSLCTSASAPVRFGAGGISGTVTVPATRIDGRSGDSPVALNLAGASVDLGRSRFDVRDLALRLGGADNGASLSIAWLEGGFVNAIGGTLSGLDAQLAAVPLLAEQGGGEWRWNAGALAIDGAVQVRDRQADARFVPMRANGLSFGLRDGVVDATARLVTAEGGVAVADLSLRHNLSLSAGDARFDVPGISFARDGFQPVQLTNLVNGVVANVDGTVRGAGQIRWNGNGEVTSTGSFSTESMDLAAAFGPVRGLAGTINFSDLLALETPPGQNVRLASVNPGVEVTDGVLGYQLLAGQRVRIEGARWPFAGGELTMRPTVMDFSADVARDLVFDVNGVDAGIFLTRFQFDNISASGVFDGSLPTRFDSSGGRVEGGYLRSRGGGTLAYVGELTQRDLGVMANIAFRSLRSLQYDQLDIRLNGRIDGEMLTEVEFGGLAQGDDAERNFLTRAVEDLPIRFRILINAPFRALLSSARGLMDPTLLIDQNLPQLIAAQRERLRQQAQPDAAQPDTAQPDPPSVQPPSSDNRQ